MAPLEQVRRAAITRGVPGIEKATDGGFGFGQTDFMYVPTKYTSVIEPAADDATVQCFLGWSVEGPN